MPRRLIMLCLLAALSALSTGCCGRIRQCIANRWHANHQYGGYGGAACCTPAFKVPSYPGAVGYSGAAGCSSCEGGGAGAAMMYQGPMAVPAGVPSIGYPMPLLGPSAEHVPSTMPPKN